MKPKTLVIGELSSCKNLSRMIGRSQRGVFLSTSNSSAKDSFVFNGNENEKSVIDSLSPSSFENKEQE